MGEIVSIDFLREQLRQRSSAGRSSAARGAVGFSVQRMVPWPGRGWPGSSFALDFNEFLPGTITELLTSDPGSLGLVFATLLGEPAFAEEFPQLALVDPADRFDPESFSAPACSRMLWLRCRGALEAVRAADILLRDGNLGTVLLDASALEMRELGRLPASAWWRLKQGAQAGGSRLIALTPAAVVPCASLRLGLEADLAFADLDGFRADLVSRLQPRVEVRRHAN